MKNLYVGVALVALCTSANPGQALAGVTPKEAAALKTTLMPLGGEKAGNADGTIPAWAGGMTSDPQYTPGGRRDHLFKGDKPLFEITSQNMNQYTDNLTEGTKALFAKYPDYKLEVYKTVRAAAAPQWMYDNTFKNATDASIVQGSAGSIPKNAFGGIPFPIPKSGVEAIWNHVLCWRGPAYHFDFHAYLVTAEGKQVLTLDGRGVQQHPYYYEKSKEDFEQKGSWYQYLVLMNAGPPIRAGEGLVQNLNLNSDNDVAWVYLTGQRRVRKLPNACCDTPHLATAGLQSFDEIFTFYGRTDRFDWKLAGKKEMYVPYNNNQLVFSGKDNDKMLAHYLNPDFTRYEKHRVWIVDATLAPGKRHVAPRGRYYIDEDTWSVLLVERYDSKGQLWKVLWQLPFAAPDVPAEFSQSFGFYDLLSGAWFWNGAFAELEPQFPYVKPQPDADFTPDALAADGVR